MQHRPAHVHQPNIPLRIVLLVVAVAGAGAGLFAFWLIGAMFFNFIGAPDAVRERIFLHGLHTGMPHADVVARAKFVGRVPERDDPREVDVAFNDFVMICATTTTHVLIRFDARGQVRDWKLDEHTDGC